MKIIWVKARYDCTSVPAVGRKLVLLVFAHMMEPILDIEEESRQNEVAPSAFVEPNLVLEWEDTVQERAHTAEE